MFLLRRKLTKHETKTGVYYHYRDATIVAGGMDDACYDYSMLPIVNENGENYTPMDGDRIWVVMIIYNIISESFNVLDIMSPVIGINNKDYAKKIAEMLTPAFIGKIPIDQFETADMNENTKDILKNVSNFLQKIVGRTELEYTGFVVEEAKVQYDV